MGKKREVPKPFQTFRSSALYKDYGGAAEEWSPRGTGTKKENQEARARGHGAPIRGFPNSAISMIGWLNPLPLKQRLLLKTCY